MATRLSQCTEAARDATQPQRVLDSSPRARVVSCSQVSRVVESGLIVGARQLGLGPLVLAVATALLVWPAVANGYPFVYWDTGAYIWSSLDRVVPVDRPIAYGLFFAVCRVLVRSVWLPVVVQAAATAALMLRVTMVALQGYGSERRRLVLALVVFSVTAVTTGLPRFAAFVMPDVFSGWLVLGGVLLVLGTRAADRGVGAAAIVTAVLVHNSNLLLGAACGLVFVAAGAAKLIRGRQSVAPLAAVLVIGLPLAVALNVVFGAGLTVSRGAPTFLVNRLAASGVLSETLATDCPRSHWALCGAQDLIRQPHADANWWFLWGDDSPLQQLGWEQGGGEQSDIVWHALACCWPRIVSTSLDATWQQLQRFDPSQDLPRLDASAGAFNAIRLVYPADFAAFARSEQQTGGAPWVRLLPGDDAAVYGISSVVAILVLVGCLRRELRAPALVLFVALVAVVLNGVTSGAVNGPVDRQQARVAWLLPFALWTGAVAYFGAHTPASTASTRRLTRSSGIGTSNSRMAVIGAWPWIALAVVVGLVGSVWMWTATPRALDPDAQQYIELAHAGLIFGTYREPLWVALLMPVEAVLGASRDAARVLGVAGFIALIVAFGLVSRRLCGRVLGPALTLMLAATPWLMFQATRGLREELAAAGVVLAAAATAHPRWLAHRRAVVLAAGIGLLALLRWDTLGVVLPVLVIGFWRDRTRIRDARGGAAVLAILVSTVPIVNGIRLGDPLAHTNEHATYFAFLEFGWTRLPDSPTLSWTTYIFNLHTPLDVATRVFGGIFLGPARVFEAAWHAPMWMGAGLAALTWISAVLLRNTSAWSVAVAFVLTSLEFAFIATLMDERLGLALVPLALLTLGAALRQTSKLRRAVAEAAQSGRLGVAMVIERYHPHIAGAERQVQARGPVLATRGVAMTVVTRLVPGLSRYAVVAHAPVHRIQSSGGRILGSLTFTARALGLLVRERQDIRVVHSYSLFSPTTVGMLAKLTLGMPVVAEPLGGGVSGDLAVLRRVRSASIRIWLMRHIVDRFIALSDEVEAGLRAVGVPERKIANITNGVDVHYFSPRSKSDQPAPHDPLVVYVGRLHPEKGVDVLIEAWPLVRDRLPRARLLLVGDGPLRADLEKRACDQVCFVGLTDDPLPYLQSADCFVLPSRSEGLPVALLEAMAVGVPSVATAIGGNVDVIRDGVDGWLVPPDDVSSLARAIQHALCAPDRQRVGCAARERVVHDFSLDRTADQLAALYDELIRRA